MKKIQVKKPATTKKEKPSTKAIGMKKSSSRMNKKK
jgi:hypothetical protein